MFSEPDLPQKGINGGDNVSLKHSWGKPYEGIQPWFKESKPDIVDSALVEAYAAITKCLVPEELEQPVELVGVGHFNRYELLEHLEKRDEVGKYLAESLYEGTYASLNFEEKQQAKSDPNYLVKKTVDRLAAGARSRQRCAQG